MILNQPFPREPDIKKGLINSVISGIVVTIFLRVFTPFGIEDAPVNNLNLFAAGYGIITSLILLLIVIFEKFNPAIFDEQRWTVGKNILLYIVIIFLIGGANYEYTVIVAGYPNSFSGFLSFQLFTLAVTFIVVSFFTMFKYFRSLKYFEKKALEVEKKVSGLNPASVSEIVELLSDNKKDKISIPLKDIFYIESADNYSKIVFTKDNRISHILLRSSLKRLEEQIKQPELIRCHRTYIVQLKNVKRVTGNSQGYKLHFENVPETVPVSRKMAEKVHELLKIE